MNKYELALVVNAKVEDDVKAATVEKAQKYITRFGGVVTNVEDAGKKRLAYEVTKIIHGEEAAEIAKKTSEDLFENAGRSEDMKTTELTADEIKGGLQIADALVKAGLMKSKGEARRMIQQKGVYLNDAVVEDQFYDLKESDFDANGEAIVRKGKKNYHRFKVV